MRIREVKVWSSIWDRRKRTRGHDLKFMFGHDGRQRTGQFESVVAYPALYLSQRDTVESKTHCTFN